MYLECFFIIGLSKDKQHFLNLLRDYEDIKKICLYIVRRLCVDLHQRANTMKKHQSILVNKRQDVGIQSFKDLNAFFEHSSNVNV